jgi:hypothetical protein
MKQNTASKGQGLIEYVLIILLIIIGSIEILSLFGINLAGTFTRVACSLNIQSACKKLYFADAFDNLDAWKIIKGNWKVTNGQLWGGTGEGRIFHDLSESDYVINLDAATLLQGNGYGVYFRVSNPEKVNGYTFQYDPGYGAFILRKWVNGYELSPFAVARVKNYDWHGESHAIKLVVQGDTFMAYVDGTQVLRGRDNTYTSGGIGLRTWDNTRVGFDAITVEPVP